MKIQPEELDGLDYEETDVQEVEATVAQVPEVPVFEVPDVPSIQVPEEADQELVVTPPIPVVEELSTQEVEEVEMLDIENDESLVVENRNKQSKTKKVLNYLTSRKKLAVLKRAFHVWQLKPHEVAPLSESTHECAACGTEYQGNYCPRCGQSASVGRFSFKKALQHFLNVWGMGNRSMFRSLRDLVLRPGYMIRDYLSGMQSAYFPPFKMFFILFTFSLIIEQGITFNTDATAPEPTGNQTEMVKQEKEEAKKEISNNANKKLNIKESKMYYLGERFVNLMDAMFEKYPAIFSLVTILLFFWPMYFFLRHSPKILDLRFSEFIVAMIYTSNTFTIFLILGNLFNSYILKFFAAFMIFVAISQFSGYKKHRILRYLIISLIISVFVVLLVAGGCIGLASLMVSK
ncbi:MAG: DUF3667 domain-containing protein [Muribaculaceae bacterium]|nr:DUF3667 domain-containing protein [Muribaculaceae bacterium]